MLHTFRDILSNILRTTHMCICMYMLASINVCNYTHMHVCKYRKTYIQYDEAKSNLQGNRAYGDRQGMLCIRQVHQETCGRIGAPAWTSMKKSRRACFEVLPRAHERLSHTPPAPPLLPCRQHIPRHPSLSLACRNARQLACRHAHAGVQKCTPAGVQNAEVHTKKLDVPKKSCAENARQLACKKCTPNKDSLHRPSPRGRPCVRFPHTDFSSAQFFSVRIREK